jgi:hypothetical protein
MQWLGAVRCYPFVRQFLARAAVLAGGAAFLAVVLGANEPSDVIPWAGLGVVVAWMLSNLERWDKERDQVEEMLNPSKRSKRARPEPSDSPPPTPPSGPPDDHPSPPPRPGPAPVPAPRLGPDGPPAQSAAASAPIAAQPDPEGSTSGDPR